MINVFHGLILVLNIAEKRIRKVENILIEIFQTKIKEKQKDIV